VAGPQENDIAGILNGVSRHCDALLPVTGMGADYINRVIYNSGDPGPAAYIAHHAQNVELFVDKAAAAYIDDSNKKMKQ